MRQEFDAGLREVREALRAETVARLEGGARLVAEAAEASRGVANAEASALKEAMRKQAEAWRARTFACV